jgi:hypothetical protein
LTLLAALAVTGTLSAAEANGGSRRRAADDWVLLATRSVDLMKDNDRIDVSSAQGGFKAVRLVGVDRLIDIKRVTIVYRDGTNFVEKERMKLEHGERSFPIGRQSEDREISHVDLEYRIHVGAAGPAKVEVWGLQSGREEPEEISRAEPEGTTRGSLMTKPVDQPDDETAGSGDVLFGVQHVGSDVDRDVFAVGREYGKFSRIRLRVLGGAVRLREARVIYLGGEPDVLAVNAEIPADDYTPWLDLKGERFIKEVQLIYSARGRSQARVEIYGNYADSWYQPASGTGAFSSSNNGWLYLGGQSPLFVSIRKGLGYETDVVSVARNRGFRRLRLDVKDRAITLNELTIVYRNGDADVIQARQRVDGGTTFGPVQLKPRPVKEIRVSYRSRIFDSSARGKGYAFVEFWVQ